MNQPKKHTTNPHIFERRLKSIEPVVGIKPSIPSKAKVRPIISINKVIITVILFGGDQGMINHLIFFAIIQILYSQTLTNKFY